MASRSVARLTVPLWLCLLGCLSDQNVYPSVGTLIVHKLDTGDYQQQFLNKSGQPHPITFRANLLGFPDLPGWLRYTQRSPWHSAYLYGSPTKPGKHIIEVTAYNRNTFEILREKIIFNLLAAADVPSPYEAEFLIDNVDVEEMLPPEARHNFQVPLQELWNTQRLSVINVTSALDKGGRVPLPLPGLKEGVFVKVGSVVPFPECLYETQKPQIREQCKEGKKPVLCPALPPNDFSIDWCNVTLVEEPGSSPSPRSLRPLEWVGEFNPPSDELGDTDYLPGYLVAMLVPILIALLLCALLSYIMCCRREGVQKRDSETSEIQLVHQQSIFSNTEELRHMAANRDVPRPLSTLPMFNVRTGQRTSPMDFTGDSVHVPLILSQQ